MLIGIAPPFLLQRSHHHGFDWRRYVQAPGDGTEGRRLLQHVHAQTAKRRVGLKWYSPGEHLIYHHAQRIDVGARIQFIAPHAPCLLAGHVSGRAQHRAGARVRDGLPQLGNAEIHNLDDQFAFVPLCKEDVIGFEVTMNDSEFVSGVQPTAPLAGEVPRLPVTAMPPAA